MASQTARAFASASSASWTNNREPAAHLFLVDANKTQVQIYDYADVNVPVLRRMLEKRLRTYRALG